MAKHRTRAELFRGLPPRRKNASQEWVASCVGVSCATISRWQNAKRPPASFVREKLIVLLIEAGLEGRMDELDTSA